MARNWIQKTRMFALPLLVYAVLGFFALLWAWWPALYTPLSALVDGAPHPKPFIDLHDILLAGACFRQGVAVYRPSACLDGGVFNYAPAMLRLAYLPLGPAARMPGGVLFCLGYGAALALLPLARPRRDFWVLAAACASPAVLYGLEQGNFDVAVFILVLAALRLLLLGAVLGAVLGAYTVFLALAALKFYPASLLVLALREPAARFFAVAAAVLLAFLIYLAMYGHDTGAAVAVLPSGTPFKATFGMIDLPRGLGRLHWLAPNAAWALCAASLSGMFWRQNQARAALAQLDAPRRLFLLAGAAVMVFCFIAAQNVEYRAIFLLPTLPGLLALKRGGLIAIILLLLWEAVFRDALGLLGPAPQHVFWLLRETLWFWLMIALGRMVVAFAFHEISRLKREIDRHAIKT